MRRLVLFVVWILVLAATAVPRVPRDRAGRQSRKSGPAARCGPDAGYRDASSASPATGSNCGGHTLAGQGSGRVHSRAVGDHAELERHDRVLEADPSLSEHYQFWTFGYATGDPIPYSASRLRQSLAAGQGSSMPITGSAHSIGSCSSATAWAGCWPRCWSSTAVRGCGAT